MKYMILIITCYFLVACAYSSDVVKMGPDKYSVTGTAGSERGGAYGAKQVAVETANEYCKKLGKQVNVTNVNVATINSNGTGSADVTFNCVP